MRVTCSDLDNSRVTTTLVWILSLPNVINLPQGVWEAGFGLFILHIRIATIVRENTKFNDNFLFWYHSGITIKSEALS